MKHLLKAVLKERDLLFKAIRGGATGEIGKILLEPPVESITVDLEGGKGEFNFIGEVKTDFEFRDRSSYCKEQKIRQTVAQKYSPFKERGRAYIITAPRGTGLALSNYSVGLDWPMVSTGIVQDTLDKVQAISAPKSDAENLEDILNDFLDVLIATAEEIYTISGKVSPNEELIIHPPNMKWHHRGKSRGGGAGLDEVTPSELLGKLEIASPNVSFEDIGGQSKAKREIEGLAFAIKNPELYKKWGTRPPKGIVLYGPPGTGKTLMAKALATQAEAKFFHVEASDIASKWYGESEKIVKAIFELASENLGNTIIFFDEIDAIAPQRDGAHEATQRIIGTLLENLDGLSSKDNVMIVASTNRLDIIDPALRRPGRFDRLVEVGLPDEEGRRQIFSIHMSQSETVAGRELFNGVDFPMVLSKTYGFSGADIAEVVRRVLEEKVRVEGATGTEPPVVETGDFVNVLDNYEQIRKHKSKSKLGFTSDNTGVHHEMTV